MILNWQKGDNERIYIRKLEAEAKHYRDELVKYEQALKFACAYVQSKIGGKVDEYMEYYLEQALAELDGKDINVPSKEGER
jgi:hypothetical protein